MAWQDDIHHIERFLLQHVLVIGIYPSRGVGLGSGRAALFGTDGDRGQLGAISVERHERWYDGITRYQWLVLTIASLGWVFDIFEGQIFVASMNEAMPALLTSQIADLDSEARRGTLAYYSNITFGAFL